MARTKTRPARPAAKRRPSPSAKRPARKRTGARGPASRATAGQKPRHKARRDPETLRLRSIQPSLTVDDIEKSVRFYRDVLGFFVGERWEEGGKLLGVLLKAGACQIGLSQDDWKKGRNREKGVGTRLWCGTAQDIDALAARIKAAGGQLSKEPANEMGERHVWVDDPDGYHLSFSGPIA